MTCATDRVTQDCVGRFKHFQSPASQLDLGVLLGSGLMWVTAFMQVGMRPFSSSMLCLSSIMKHAAYDHEPPIV